MLSDINWHKVMRLLKVRQNNESCILRWTYLDKRYSLSFGLWDNPSDRAKLDVIGDVIYRDCLAGTFDFSLQKYKLWLAGIIAPPSLAEGSPKHPPLIQLLEERLVDKFNEADESVLSLVRQYRIPITNPEQAKAFMKWIAERPVATSTQRRYWNTLVALRRDLFGNIRIRVEEKPKAKPFTKVEVTKIINAFRDSPAYNCYADFVLFAFNSGCRTSESIGLRWQDVDLFNREINIYETLGRNRGSTSNRIRKTTKTAKYRVIPMNETVFQMLSSRIKKGDLIFHSPRGKVIDDHVFSQKVWKKILKQLGITHRAFYKTRATFASHCAESGMPIHEIAAILGHSTMDILFNHYLGSVKKPILPEL